MTNLKLCFALCLVPRTICQSSQVLLVLFLCSGTSGAEDSSLAICSSSLSPAVGILPVLPLPQRGILPQQGSRPSRPSFCPWEQQGPEPALPSNRALQGKTHQVRNDTRLAVNDHVCEPYLDRASFLCNCRIKMHILHVLMLRSVRLSNGNADCTV